MAISHKNHLRSTFPRCITGPRKEEHLIVDFFGKVHRGNGVIFFSVEIFVSKTPANIFTLFFDLNFCQIFQQFVVSMINFLLYAESPKKLILHNPTCFIFLNVL